MEIFAWIGGFYQAKVDPEVVKSVSLALIAAMKTPAAVELVKAGGGSYFPADPEAFRAFLAREIKVTKAIAKAAGIRLE